MTELDTLLFIERLISIGIILQTIEFLCIRKTTEQIWNWNLVQKEFAFFPSIIKPFLNFHLKFPNFNILLIARLCLALLSLFYSQTIFLFLIIYSTVLILLRWRGTFNGGSDFMTLIILMSSILASTFKDSPTIVIGCLWYISIQTCTSYFISGTIKLKSKNWRTGKALVSFINSSIYSQDSISKLVTTHRWISFASSWIIILFECSFPIVLLNQSLCLIFILFAFLFHLANSYLFGLNRFLLAWTASYPALIYCSTYFLNRNFD